MKFYCIIRSEQNIVNPDTYRLLQEACRARSIEFIPLETDKIDYSKTDDLVVSGSLLYRLAGGTRPALLEALLSDKVVTLRKDISALMAREFAWGSAIRVKQAGVPIIPTIFNVSRLHDSHLLQYVESLGGFPVVLKSSGGSHGAGVMVIDSIRSLRSVMDYVSDATSADLVLRQYIHNARHLRVVVLGDQVVDCIEYRPQPNDFRTNAVQVPQVDKVEEVPEEIAAHAVAAVTAQGLEFGGVDVLIAEDGQHYIAEVNHPCNFARNQMNTGVDIAGNMIDYLCAKAEHEQLDKN